MKTTAIDQGYTDSKPTLILAEWQAIKGRNTGKLDKQAKKLIKKGRQARKKVYNY